MFVSFLILLICGSKKFLHPKSIYETKIELGAQREKPSAWLEGRGKAGSQSVAVVKKSS